MSTYNSMPHNTNRNTTSSTQTETILQHSEAITLSSTTALHSKHSHRPPHSYYKIHKTNMRHIHTYILRTPSPRISISEEIFPRLTLRSLAQLRTHKSPFLKSYTQHTSCHQLYPHTHHIITTGFEDIPRRSDGTAGQVDGEAGWWTTSGKIGLPQPNSKG